jgi:hypothetical protein
MSASFGPRFLPLGTYFGLPAGVSRYERHIAIRVGSLFARRGSPRGVFPALVPNS